MDGQFFPDGYAAGELGRLFLPAEHDDSGEAVFSGLPPQRAGQQDDDRGGRGGQAGKQALPGRGPDQPDDGQGGQQR